MHQKNAWRQSIFEGVRIIIFPSGGGDPEEFPKKELAVLKNPESNRSSHTDI